MCRSRQAHSNAYWIAAIDVDAGENGPLKVRQVTEKTRSNIGTTVEGIWPMLDPNMSGTVTSEEFVSFCTRHLTNSGMTNEQQKSPERDL